MPVDKEYASRSVCRDYTRGECGKNRSRHWTCKFSHTLMNTARLKGLLGDVDVLKAQRNYMTLEYFGAFEIFGHYEMWAEGWRITLRARELHGRLHVFEPPLVVEFEDINKAIYELEEKLLWQGFSTGRSEVTGGGPKRDTMCKSFLEEACARGEECKFSHTLLDVRRVEVIVGSPGWYSPRASFLTLEYVVASDPFAAPAPWRITLRAREGNGNLRTLSQPIIITSDSIFIAMRSLEQEAQLEKEGANMTVKVPASAQPTSRGIQAQLDVISSQVPLSLKPTQQSSYQFGSNVDKKSIATKPVLNPSTEIDASSSVTHSQPVHNTRNVAAKVDNTPKTEVANTGQPQYTYTTPSFPAIPAQISPIAHSPPGVLGSPPAIPRTPSVYSPIATADYQSAHTSLISDTQQSSSRAANSSQPVVGSETAKTWALPAQSQSTMLAAVPRPSSFTSYQCSTPPNTPLVNTNHRNAGSYPQWQGHRNREGIDESGTESCPSKGGLFLLFIILVLYIVWYHQ